MKRLNKVLLAASIITMASFAKAQVDDLFPVVVAVKRKSPEKIDTWLTGQSIQNLLSAKDLDVNLGNLYLMDQSLQENADTELLKNGRKVSVNLQQGNIEISGIIEAPKSEVDLSEAPSEHRSALADLFKNGIFVTYLLSDCKSIVLPDLQSSNEKLMVVCKKVERTIKNSKAQNVTGMMPSQSEDESSSQQAIISFTAAKLSKDQIPSLKKIAGKTMIQFRSETSDTLFDKEIEQLTAQGLSNSDFYNTDFVSISGRSFE